VLPSVAEVPEIVTSQSEVSKMTEEPEIDPDDEEVGIWCFMYQLMNENVTSQN
jgi:hypothetical protein